jgi:hypothetical protein
LAGRKVQIKEEEDAKKRSYPQEDAWQVIAGADRVVVAVGKKTVEFDPKSADREEMLKKITGPSGNLRAPTLRIGRVYYVGFHPQLYEEMLS